MLGSAAAPVLCSWGCSELLLEVCGGRSFSLAVKGFLRACSFHSGVWGESHRMSFHPACLTALCDFLSLPVSVVTLDCV